MYERSSDHTLSDLDLGTCISIKGKKQLVDQLDYRQRYCSAQDILCMHIVCMHILCVYDGYTFEFIMVYLKTVLS